MTDGRPVSARRRASAGGEEGETMREHTPARVALRCSCGGSASGAITAGDAERRFLAIWHRVHSGPGHETENRADRMNFTAELAKESMP